MNTEITDNTVPEFQGWTLYDGGCEACRRLAARIEPRLLRSGYLITPLQAPWVGEVLGLSPADLIREFRVLKADGTLVCGFDAVVLVARILGWPVHLVRDCAWFKPVVGSAYAWIADNRKRDEQRGAASAAPASTECLR